MLMDIIWQVCKETLTLLRQVLPAMFFGLFGVELLVRLGLMRRLEVIGEPLTRISHLPPQSIHAFLTSFGSLIAANVMLARHYEEKIISREALVLGSVFN